MINNLKKEIFELKIKLESFTNNENNIKLNNNNKILNETIYNLAYRLLSEK
jgi:hypothetical protein